MNIDLAVEKERKLSTQEHYDIIRGAINMANENGFINDFVFSRALILNTVQAINEDKSKYGELIAENVFDAWDTLLEENVLDSLLDEYALDLELLAEEAKVWCAQYIEFSVSAQGVLNQLVNTSNTLLADAKSLYSDVMSQPEMYKVLETADNFGINRPHGQVGEPTLADILGLDNDATE